MIRVAAPQYSEDRGLRGVGGFGRCRRRGLGGGAPVEVSTLKAKKL